MLRKDTILLETPKSLRIRTNIPQLLHKEVQSFVGYCIGQSKKYNIKGARYTELVELISILQHSTVENINVDNFKYIKRVMAPGSRGSKGFVDIPYISVLGKLFDTSLSTEYILDKVIQMEKQYGNRVKDTTVSVDYKALSHAVRVLLEVEELLTTGNILFPLTYSTYLKDIKTGTQDLDEVMEVIANGIARVDSLMESSTLPKSPDKVIFSKLLLELLNAPY